VVCLPSPAPAATVHPTSTLRALHCIGSRPDNTHRTRQGTRRQDNQDTSAHSYHFLHGHTHSIKIRIEITISVLETPSFEAAPSEPCRGRQGAEHMKQSTDAFLITVFPHSHSPPSTTAASHNPPPLCVTGRSRSGSPSIHHHGRALCRWVPGGRCNMGGEHRRAADAGAGASRRKRKRRRSTANTNTNTHTGPATRGSPTTARRIPAQ
jgi:hypothetical protein